VLVNPGAFPDRRFSCIGTASGGGVGAWLRSEAIRIVSAASIAMSAYVRWPPGLRLGVSRQASSAVSESQRVRSPRFWSPASYSAQLRTRYRDFACL